MRLSVGINAADPLRLGEQLELLEGAGVSCLHVDVMDGRFCPPITVGPGFVAALPKRATIDVHLMIEEPLRQVEAFVAAGAGIVTFHVEATRHPHRVLQQLAGSGVSRGVALNPGTPLSALEPLLDELELVLLLSVNPGWPGQSFIPATAERLAAARALIGELEIALGVDGGVTHANAGAVAAMGPDLIVAGSAVFAGEDLAHSARAMLAAVGASGS